MQVLKRILPVLAGLSVCYGPLLFAETAPPPPPGLTASKQASSPAAQTDFPKPTTAQIPTPTPAPPNQPHPAATVPTQVGVPSLAWDAKAKEYSAKQGEMKALFVFSLTNISDHEVVITNAKTSCGCTVAKLPSEPWHIPASSNGEIHAEMNLSGKPPGTATKMITVNTSEGFEQLSVSVHIPAPLPVLPGQMSEGERERNMQMAANNRQVVFQNSCAECHVKKGVAKMSKELYDADCGICHDSARRASGVPDLHHLPHPTDLAYWKDWIANSQPGKMMPAFSMKNGGPLTDEQIDSVANYLTATISQSPGLRPPNAAPLPTRLR